MLVKIYWYFPSPKDIIQKNHEHSISRPPGLFEEKRAGLANRRARHQSGFCQQYARVLHATRPGRCRVARRAEQGHDCPEQPSMEHRDAAAPAGRRRDTRRQNVRPQQRQSADRDRPENLDADHRRWVGQG